MRFIGRKELLKHLRVISTKTEAGQLVCIYGRRRVGKTTLVEKAFQDYETFIGLEGQESGDKQTQINVQLRLFKEVLPNIEQSKKVKSWEDFFDLVIKNLSKGPTVLFLDEFQWMACMRDDLVGIFKLYWDRHFKKKKDLIIIICGSVSSFIVKKVIRSKALYGRINHEIAVEPLSLQEINDFFKGTLIEKDFLKYAMCFGGIPEYLHRVDTNKGFSENLVELAFTKNAYFTKEYHRIFTSHFGTKEIYERIIEALDPSGMTAADIAIALKMESGGSLTEALRDLVLAGLITKNISIDAKLNSKYITYKINDEYLLLYKTLISKYLGEIETGNFNSFDLINNKTMAQWYGYAFERLCCKNSKLIASHLGFSGINYKSGSWFRKTDKTKIQIDLLFVRADKVISVCEIKHQSAFKAKKIIENFERTLNILKEYFPDYSFQKVLISDQDLKNNELQQYFHKLINLKKLGQSSQRILASS